MVTEGRIRAGWVKAAATVADVEGTKGVNMGKLSSSSKLSIISANPNAAVKREMLTVRGDRWLAGCMGRWGRTLEQYTGFGNPGGASRSFDNLLPAME